MYIERDGAQLFYTAFGEGPDVVLLHPTPLHHEFWLPTARSLADRFRCTLIDLRGHGESGAGTGTITMERLAEDVHAIVLKCGIRRPAFVGCSIGAYLIYEYWRRFPQGISAMAFICGKPQRDSAENRERRRATIHSLSQPGGLENFFDAMADTLIGSTAQKRSPETRLKARAMMKRMPVEAVIAVQQGLMERPDSVPTLRGISVPVCAIAGGEDQGSTPAEMHVIAEQVAGAEFHPLPDAGHYAPMEQPEKIARILAEFLEKHPNKTGES